MGTSYWRTLVCTSFYFCTVTQLLLCILQQPALSGSCEQTTGRHVGLLIICSSFGKCKEKHQVAKKKLSPGKQGYDLDLISILPNIPQQNQTSVSWIAVDSWFWRKAGRHNHQDITFSSGNNTTTKHNKLEWLLQLQLRKSMCCTAICNQYNFISTLCPLSGNAAQSHC